MCGKLAAMPTILGISGSARRKSYNAALLRLISELAPEDCPVEMTSIRGIPLYDGDFEASEKIPPSVAALKDRVAAVGGLLLVTCPFFGKNLSVANASNVLDTDGRVIDEKVRDQARQLIVAFAEFVKR
jgi:NADPH-dependent FMN reductase